MEKTFDAARAEARLYAAWEKAGAFKAGANAKPKADGSPAEPFCMMIPPPNVTGSLHMGHAFNHTLQDILVRWHRMRGFDTLWQPGTDHAGIATQMVVERELAETNRRRTDFSRAEFEALVWEQKRKSEATILGQLKRLGASCDWDRTAFTMDPNFQQAVIKVFVDMYNKGQITRGKRLVNWDPHFETAISDLEVEQTEVAGHMWHFKYPLAANPETGERATYDYVEKDQAGTVTLRETRDYIAIATTRPETMLGDGAVAVHPSDQRYAPIVGKLCEIPVGPKDHRRLIPIITDDYPDPAFGSGAVKITGAHDFNDYGVAMRNNIPLYALMDTRAHMRTDGLGYAESATIAGAIARGEQTAGDVSNLNLVPEELRGLDRYEARDKIVAQITADGLAVMTTADDPNTCAPTRAIEGRRKRIELGVWTGPEGEYYVCEEQASALAAASAKYPDKIVRVTDDSEFEDNEFYDPQNQKIIVFLRPAYPKVENKPIMQPFGDRSKVVIEPMLTDQWFVDTAMIVQPAIDAVKDGRTKILPEQHEKVYFHWLENIEPWCISRQLWWGHQIPVWYGLNLWTRDVEGPSGDLDEVDLVLMLLEGGIVHEGEHHHCAVDFGGVTDAFHHDIASLPQPLNAARVVEVADRQAAIHALAASLAEYAVSEDPTHLVYPVWRDPDVLDTWFSSGLWPIGTLGWPADTPELKKYFPTSVLVTGFDIIFFWVARMMMMQLAVVNEVPFRSVYVHALVRDEKGKKMSKSLGNVLDPLDLIDEYGADAVRFTLTAMAAMGRDLKLSKDRIAGYRNFGTKLWNATRFAEMNGVFGPEVVCMEYASDIHAKHTVNRWIIGETARARIAVDEALANYRFNDAANTLYAFVWGKVCDWYVEFAKPLMDGDHAAETRATMRWVLDQCFTLMHPIMPFITEELWALTGTRTKPLVHADWPTYGPELIDADADREMNWVIGLIEEIRSVRVQMHVPAGLKLDLEPRGGNADQLGWLSGNTALVERLARVNIGIVNLPSSGNGVTFHGSATGEVGAAPRGYINISVEGAAFALKVEGVIDVAAEKARLSKALEKKEKDISGRRGRLNNPKYVASAPEDVVAESRENLALDEDEAGKIRTALARLAEVG